MSVSAINFSNFNIVSNKNLPNNRIFIQKPDTVSFSGKRAFSFTDKGVLQTSIDECKNKEVVESLLKNEDGLFKYRPFTVFEILTQKDKPNFEQNLKVLQEFKLKEKPIHHYFISGMLVACNGQEVKPRLDLLTSVTEEKGIDVPLVLFCTDNDKFKIIKKHLEQIDDANKDKIISKCFDIAEPNISKPTKILSEKEKLLNSIFGAPKPQKDDLEKLIESGEYKNISMNALKKYKEEHFENYAELYQKSKNMPQLLDMINHIAGLGQHSKYKDSWLRKELKNAFNFENVANIVLQKDFPKFIPEFEVLNKLLFGKQNPELKARLKEFKERTGINLYADSNIPVSYIDRYEKIIPDLKHHFGENSDIAGANISTLTGDYAGGFCVNSGIIVSPLQSDYFEETLFHEYAHVAHKHCVPYDGKNQSYNDAWLNLQNKKFYPEDSIEYKTTVSQLREYAAKNFAEFVAVLNEQVGVGKFEVVINDKGEKVLRKYLKDGDTTTAEDLEILMNIYKSVWGPDIGAKKASDKSSEYVETPFIGAPKFDFMEFFLQQMRKEKALAKP